MTFEIGLVLSLLAGAVALFIIEKPRADVVSLLLLGSLVVTGLLEPTEALSGFSSPAVVTVWAVFILSGGLSKTGVANLLGDQVLRLAGTGEVRLMVLIMLVSGVLSAFMNNVGTTALLLPVVMDLARRTGTAPSKLLIPLSFSSLLGGMQTLIGTPPNILIAEAVRTRELGDLGMFAFTPVGTTVLLSGVLFMVLIGRHLLPDRDLAKAAESGGDLTEIFQLHKRLLMLLLPENSPLDGRTVAECRIRQALGLTVIGIVRGERTRLAPAPNDLLQSGDRLLVEGRPRRFEELRKSPVLTVGPSQLMLERVSSSEVDLVVMKVVPESVLIGRTLREVGFRQRFGGAVVVAVRRRGELLRTQFDERALQVDDVLLLQASAEEVEQLAREGGLEQLSREQGDIQDLDSQLLRLRVPEGSVLVGKPLSESRLAEAFGLMLLSVERGDRTITRPGPDQVIDADDSLIVKGSADDLATMLGLQSLQVERRVDQTIEEVESERVGLAVVAVAPNARIARKTLRDLHFREKYGLSVLAIWRQGKVLRTGLANRRLMFGDALLLHGPRNKLAVLATEPDFLVLSAELQEAPRYTKAPVSLLCMAGVLAAVISGWLPIYIAAIIGATLMVVLGCISIEEAYREIEWRAVFLIAGMLPLGLAMEKTGAALFIAEQVVAVVGGVGPIAILGGLFLLAVAGAQVMPTSATALLLAPIAIDTAGHVDLSPLPLVMAVAVGSSTAFISPVTHPANVLVMGPGGYRFSDYSKVGVPLVLVVLLVVLLVLPLVFPLQAP